METKLTKLLGITYPIIQGGMAWISEANLATAVSNAGGAGIIASGGRATDWVRAEIRKAKTLTNKPFGVNVMLMAPNKDEIVDVLCEEKVAFVTLGAGNPIPYFAKFHQAGIKVIPVVPNVKLAKRVEAAGADAIVIEGMEAGGHIGTMTTMALLTNVIPEISVPVIAAGGIVDGRGIAAALLMGASGVQMGSRFLLTEECTLHPKAKQRIIEAEDTDSVVTGYSRGHGVRGLKSKFTDKYLELERSGAPQDELDALATGTNRLAAVDGDVETGLVQVGQSLNRLKDIKPVKQVIEELMAETIRTLSNAGNLVK
ncbi:nitronate monooxygenase [Sporolituus thermophilus]|uniref:Probable nitronate monooxygenase n=1 Tax=Sporolituus thermophilus DSM 23256 TaxID=1123285 RepID=A0A1G7MQE9_9FIRM|nr:nitronate monooxygenase [Sporolituus thermophilus]SDF64013.1 enoyl-[acyl-carrier protein] reductase II [Sporolituus thermophilus DSM 23256]